MARVDDWEVELEHHEEIPVPAVKEAAGEFIVGMTESADQLNSWGLVLCGAAMALGYLRIIVDCNEDALMEAYRIGQDMARRVLDAE